MVMVDPGMVDPPWWNNLWWIRSFARLGGVARGQQVQRTDAAAICEAGGTRHPGEPGAATSPGDGWRWCWQCLPKQGVNLVMLISSS